MRARDIMSRPVVSVDTRSTVRDAVTALTEHGFAAVPVIDDGDRVVGMFSESDGLRAGHRPGEPVTTGMAAPVEVVVRWGRAAVSGTCSRIRARVPGTSSAWESGQVARPSSVAVRRAALAASPARTTDTASSVAVASTRSRPPSGSPRLVPVPVSFSVSFSVSLRVPAANVRMVVSPWTCGTGGCWRRARRPASPVRGRSRWRVRPRRRGRPVAGTRRGRWLG
jgi:CBS domain-containing protein